MGNRNEKKELLGRTEPSLSDFVLFLAVMKNKEAYEATLSLIMDQADLELKEVRVEEVVLNRSGKRAIRLDAWALDSKNIQYNTEMQNDTEHDDVRRRPELVSLLQYMKESRLDNPEILVQDERIRRIDAIVQEVKETEEWEDAQMSILSIGIEKGREEGMEKGMEKARRQMARNLFRRGFPAEETAELTEVPHPVVQSWYREWEKQ